MKIRLTLAVVTRSQRKTKLIPGNGYKIQKISQLKGKLERAQKKQ